MGGREALVGRCAGGGHWAAEGLHDEPTEIPRL